MSFKLLQLYQELQYVKKVNGKLDAQPKVIADLLKKMAFEEEA